MARPAQVRGDATLKVLIRHLVLSFPQAAILSRSVGGRYHVCVIVPYDGGAESIAARRVSIRPNSFHRSRRGVTFRSNGRNERARHAEQESGCSNPCETLTHWKTSS
jgi:hypothetical protein